MFILHTNKYSRMHFHKHISLNPKAHVYRYPTYTRVLYSNVKNFVKMSLF